MSPRAAHVVMHVTVFLWGLTALLGHAISIPAVPLVWYRLIMVTAMMAIIVAALRLDFRVTRQSFWRLATIGALVGLHWLLFYGCIKYAGIAVAVLCLSASTFFTAVLEPIIFRRAPLVGELAIGVLAAVGVSLLVKIEAQATALGLALGLGSAFFAASFGTLNGRYVREAPPEVMTLYELGIAAVVTTFFFTVWPADFVAPWRLSGHDALLLAVLAGLCTVVPWLTSLAILKTLSPYTLALAVTLEPVYAIILAWFVFPDNNRLSYRFYLGAALLIGLIAVNAVIKRHGHGQIAARPGAA